MCPVLTTGDPSRAYHAHKGLPQEKVQQGCQGGEAEQQGKEQGHITLGKVPLGTCMIKNGGTSKTMATKNAPHLAHSGTVLRLLLHPA